MVASAETEVLRNRGFVRTAEHICETGPYPPLPFFYRSESPSFAAAVDSNGWRWIGPDVSLEDIYFTEIRDLRLLT